MVYIKYPPTLSGEEMDHFVWLLGAQEGAKVYKVSSDVILIAFHKNDRRFFRVFRDSETQDISRYDLHTSLSTH